MLNLLRRSAFGLALFIYLISVPLYFLAAIFPGDEVIPLWQEIGVICGVLFLLTAGFVFVFAYGIRMLSSIRLRLIAGVFLTVPIAISALPLVLRHLEFGLIAIPMLLFSVLLFSAFVFPAWLKWE